MSPEKPIHWTQRPENKARLRQLRQAAVQRKQQAAAKKAPTGRTLAKVDLVALAREGAATRVRQLEQELTRLQLFLAATEPRS